MADILFQNISEDPVILPGLKSKAVSLSILRLDKIHPLISGNKWFKLRYYLEEAARTGKKTIVTKGGAWSNHILATAAASRLTGLSCCGIIRGEESPVHSFVLQEARSLGMRLFFMSRGDYDSKKIPEELNDESFYFIPEGGYGEKGALGAAGILDHCDKNAYTHFCCAVGTGTMIAGLVRGISPVQKVTGISILKNNLALEKEIRQLIPGVKNNFELFHDYHFGGYAKYNNSLVDFMNTFYRHSAVPTDFVYMGKLCYAISDLVQKNHFPPQSRILIIHSGGLAGNNSLEKGTLIF